MNATAETPAAKPSDEEIREYAYHLYVQSGSVPGRDLENWLEAEAALTVAFEPETALRSRRSRVRRKSSAATLPEVKNLAV